MNIFFFFIRMQAVKAWRGRQSGVKSSPDGGYLGLVGEPAPCVLQVRAVRMPGWVECGERGSFECYENNGSQKPLGTGRTSL